MEPGFERGARRGPLSAGADRLRSGQRGAVELAVDGQRQGIETHNVRRHHMGRQPCGEMEPQRVGRDIRIGYGIGHQPPATPPVIARQHRRLAHRGMVQQRRLDFPR
ncbi:MAG TPA: hypothetical protein VGC09_11230, partial [Rhodopila sp.]